MRSGKIFVALLIFLTIGLNAQNRISVGAGYETAIPVGDFNDLAKTGHIWKIFGEYSLSPKFSLQLISGIMTFPTEIPQIAVQGNVITFDLKGIPILAAVKYYVVEQLFVQAESGVNFIKVSADFQGAYGNPTTESSDYKAKFTIGGGLGYDFILSEQSSLNLSAKYIYVDGGDLNINFNHILIGAGLLIHFKI